MALIGKDIEYAKELLTQGDLVAIPTETVYGLAANALNSAAVAKIFSVKNRPSFDPLIVHVPDLESIDRWVSFVPVKAKKLAEKFWPGPLTLVLPRQVVIPDLVTSGLDTVGLRCPAHALTQHLLQSLPFPLAAPSANPFGYISPTSPQHVQDQLGEKIPYILDGGICQVGIESTIVGFEDDDVVIYRLGGLSVEDLAQEIGTVKVSINTSSNPLAPGQLKSHYAPRKKLVLGDLDKLVSQYGADVAILAFREQQKNVAPNRQRILSATGNLQEAAQRLFTLLRELDQMDSPIILAERVPEIDLGRAINDRLQRASAG